MLNVVIAEAALELVPKELAGSAAVKSDARRRESDPKEILLDRSFHHSAMSMLKDSEKRGRPDLVHVTMLSVTGTPLYLDGGVRLFIYTYPGLVLEVEEKTRVPKNYMRFRGLMEKALVERPREGLVRVYPMGFAELVRGKIPADRVFGLSLRGRQMTCDELAGLVASRRNPCVIIGGFPRGHFSEAVVKSMDELVRIDPRPLEAHVVASRVVYEVEKAQGRIND